MVNLEMEKMVKCEVIESHPTRKATKSRGLRRGRRDVVFRLISKACSFHIIECMGIMLLEPGGYKQSLMHM